jgi:hypothetical protein
MRQLGGPDKWYSTTERDPASPYASFDQDALNIAMLTSVAPFSVVGREGMDFIDGG